MTAPPPPTLVTGAAGFIGSHCCEALLQAGRPVVGLDNFDPYYDRTLKESAVAMLRRYPDFRFVEGDIRDAALIDRLVQETGAVVHLAARPGVRPSFDDPALYADVNVTGTAVLLTACQRVGLRRFVFASSSSVYGDDTPVPFREDAPASDPLSPYAATRRAGELLCRAYAAAYGFRVAVLRLFTVYGPRQRPDLAIHRFTALLTAGRPVPQFGDGSSERDYTHVNDVVQGIVSALRWLEREDEATRGQPLFEIFNLGGSRTVRLDRLIGLIAQALGTRPTVERLPMPAGDVRRTWADVSKARRILGYQPRVSIEEGIADFVSWYRSAHERLGGNA